MRVSHAPGARWSASQTAEHDDAKITFPVLSGERPTRKHRQEAQVCWPLAFLICFPSPLLRIVGLNALRISQPMPMRCCPLVLHFLVVVRLFKECCAFCVLSELTPTSASNTSSHRQDEGCGLPVVPLSFSIGTGLLSRNTSGNSGSSRIQTNPLASATTHAQTCSPVPQRARQKYVPFSQDRNALS